MKEDKFSKTALSISLGQFVTGLHEPMKSLISPEQAALAEALLKKYRPQKHRRFGRIRKYHPLVKALGAVQGFFTIPGLSIFHLCRKKAFEKSLEKILAESQDYQVVALAAGFDTLTLRMAEKYPDIEFFETDHPATQEIKKDMYQEMGYGAPNNTVISCDYTKEDLRDILRNHKKFETGKNTIFLAEGLVFYLPYDIFLDLTSYTKEFTDTQSHMIFSYLNYKPGSNTPGFAGQGFYVDYWLKKVGEPFLWARNKEELIKDLGQEGYKLSEFYDAEELRRQFLDGKPLRIASGEDICTLSFRK